MSKFSRILALAVFIGILAACTRSVPGSDSGPNPNATSSPEAVSDATTGQLGVGSTDLQLSVQVSNSGDTFDTVGQIINYNYELSNNDPDTDFPGPLVITDDKVVVTCPDLNAIGNSDNTLDPSESVTCTGTYSLTQADLEAEKVVNNASASMDNGAVTSNVVSLEVPILQTRELTLTITTDPTTYDRVGQVITFSYEILNSGNVTLGPDQFVIEDNGGIMSVSLDCGEAAASLPPDGSINCSTTYAVTQADLDNGSVASDAVAIGYDTWSSGRTILTVWKDSEAQPPSSSLTPGTTIQHTVTPGDWLMQIARCYGADYESVRRANPHIYTPNMIWSGQVVSVPNIGSAGPIHDKPCVIFHTAVAGDTWASLAQQYDARLDVLQEVNPGGLFVGANIKVPINSAGGSSAQGPVAAPIVPPPAKMERVTDIFNGPGDSNPAYMTAYNGALYFGANGDDGAGQELWKYDGTNVKRISDIWVGPDDTNPSYMTEYNGRLFFTADLGDSFFIRQLASYDDTTRNIRTLYTDTIDHSYLAVYDGLLYYAAISPSAINETGDDFGYELYKNDGTTGSLAADIASGGAYSHPRYLTVYDGALYFTADENDGAGREIWKFDGASPSRISSFWNRVEELGPKYLTVYNDAIYFSAEAYSDIGIELVVYDGSDDGDYVDVRTGPDDSSPSDLAVYNGALYFAADGGDGAGRELWMYDGTTASRVADIRGGSESSNPEYLTVYNGALYFAADSGDGAGRELWMYISP